MERVHAARALWAAKEITMNTLSILFHLVGGNAPDDGAVPCGRSQRLLLAVSAALGTIVLGAAWGLAAGGGHARTARANVVEVPMLLIVSALASLPAVLLLWKLVAGGARTSDLVVSYAIALFGGTLVLAVLSPLVALYQHSSAWVGPYVAIGSAVLAYATGAMLLVRVFGRLAGEDTPRRTLIVPAVGLFLLQAAALAQLVSIIPPVLGERTVFGRGIDGIVAPLHPAPRVEGPHPAPRVEGLAPEETR
jgi:hypothetical protein